MAIHGLDLLRARVILQCAILLPLLIVIALTQILPQVDLPDTAFHEDTAPIVTKFRAVAAPVLTITMLRDLVTYARMASLAALPNLCTGTRRTNRPLPILFSVFLC